MEFSGFIEFEFFSTSSYSIQSPGSEDLFSSKQWRTQPIVPCSVYRWDSVYYLSLLKPIPEHF